MNSLDIIRYACMALALFLVYVAGYASGHRDGKREGYSRGRSITRITTSTTNYDLDAHTILDKIIKDEIKKQAASK